MPWHSWIPRRPSRSLKARIFSIPQAERRPRVTPAFWKWLAPAAAFFLIFCNPGPWLGERPAGMLGATNLAPSGFAIASNAVESRDTLSSGTVRDASRISYLPSTNLIRSSSNSASFSWGLTNR